MSDEKERERLMRLNKNELINFLFHRKEWAKKSEIKLEAKDEVLKELASINKNIKSFAVEMASHIIKFEIYYDSDNKNYKCNYCQTDRVSSKWDVTHEDNCLYVKAKKFLEENK